MNLNYQVNEQIDKLFPDHLSDPSPPSKMEQRVEDFVNSALLKGCHWWETAGNALSTVKSAYKAMWIPYTMLKHPFAHKNLLVNDSPVKNLHILANATAANIHHSVITPHINRQIPRIYLSSEIISKISNLATLTFPFFFILTPAKNTLYCLKNGNGAATLDPWLLANDFGRCLNEGAKTYQGPEAMVLCAVTIALGTITALSSQALMTLFLVDNTRQGRYEEVDRIYTNVAMYLKNDWDEAVQQNNIEVKKQCIELAMKLSTNLDLIEKTLESRAALTSVQANEMKLKLAWACNYVLNHDKQKA